MRWSDVRSTHPERWLVVEALEAHPEGRRRVLDRVSVVELCADGGAAFRRYCELHRMYPSREFYPVHTHRERIEIAERSWFEPGDADETRPPG